MARREDDSYTNGSVSMNDFSVEDGRKEKEVYDHDEPEQDGLCGMPVSVPFLQMVRELIVVSRGIYTFMLCSCVFGYDPYMHVGATCSSSPSFSRHTSCCSPEWAPSW